MAFTVEDGTGVVNANSYGTLQGFRDYFADRQEDVSAILDATVQLLLVASTDYIDSRWHFLGNKEFTTLNSRSNLTLVAQVSDGESVTFGSNTYIFRTSPTATLEVEIGSDMIETLENLASSIGSNDIADYSGSLFADVDVATLTLYANDDGVVTTETGADSSFDGVVTAGRSRKYQPLQFPRVGIRDRRGAYVTGIPENLKQATYEYALRANTSALAPDPVTADANVPVIRQLDKVGPITTETEYAEGGLQITFRSYPEVDALLKEYVLSTGRSFR